MKSIPLTRARHATNFAIAMQDKGEKPDGLLASTHLDAELLHGIGGDGVISAISMLEFAENAAHRTGIRDLGFWAGLVPIEGYGAFGRHVINAPTLHGAIMTFCREVKSECSGSDYFLRIGDEEAWFCHGLVPGGEVQQSQHELYALMIITQVIRLALGADWQPDQIRLQSRDDSGARVNDYLLNTTIEFGAPITAVRFPKEKLAAPLNQPETIATASHDDKLQENTTGFPEDPLVAIKALITLYIREANRPNIEIAADIAGVSKRTLQRYLGSRATSYHRLVDEVKYEIALPLLKDPANTVTAISSMLGYSDIAHFSRAFKRITGISPRAYRELIPR